MAGQPPPASPPAEAPVFTGRPEPGMYDLLHSETRGIMAANYVFEGGRFSFSKPVGQHMQLQHQIQLGKEPSYHFSPTYVGTLRQVSPQETFPIIMADIDHKGSLMTQIIHEFSKSFRLRTQLQTEGSDFKGVQVEADFTGGDFTSSLKAVNVDFLAGTGIWIGSYLQKVTSALSMGAECMYQYGPGGEQAVPSFAGRYRGSNFTATSTVSPAGMVEASYHHQYTDAIQFGTNMDINLQQGTVNANVGFQTNFKSSVVRGQVSAQGVVSSYYEKQLAPAVNFILAMMVDHAKGDNSFGVGLSIGQ